jgi:predicted O-linked N-acetylglucosamine transferase (SPINDLY family)
MSVIQSIEFYEAAILADETIVSNYLYLGLSYLLAGKEEDAQSAWFVAFAQSSEAEGDLYPNLLLAILEQEATHRSQVSELEKEWSIRQQLWILKPDRVKNILDLIILADALDRLTVELLIEWQIDILLPTTSVGSLDDLLLEKTIAVLLQQKVRTDLTLSIVKSCLNLTGSLRTQICQEIVETAFDLFHRQRMGLFAIRLVEICQAVSIYDLDILQVLAGMYSELNLHAESIAVAEYFHRLATHPFEQIFGSYLIQKSYLTAGNWQGYLERLVRHRKLLNKIIIDSQGDLQKNQHQSLIVVSFFTPYIEDNPRINKPLQNKLAAIYQNNLNPLLLKYEIDELSLAKQPGLIRIGYLASTLREHSVGWLSRWLFHYHDRQSFQVFNYCINQSAEDPFNHKWFRDKTDVTYYFNNNYQEITAKIKADEIDILIDLDSLTFDTSCMVMAHKPAPVQATWLGLDASGIPAIDYFIADPYVLPDDAQDYYQEKIWRLPQTYVAVDGFEVGIPTLNRKDLGIPDDAVVYFSSQGGYKRHPDNIRCQMQIIKAVPNSYFLIKGKSDRQMIRDFFGKLAQEEGVSFDRLRFLDGVPDEATHRANLGIADIVLDTFPYNGATTTLETLWMGIPMVTQVGEQFAARNSYTFMLNAGISEGIAWNQQEYIDWGVKLGLDRELRLKVHDKLRSGRNTAPIWNARQFTRNLEQAYQEMWSKHLASQSQFV